LIEEVMKEAQTIQQRLEDKVGTVLEAPAVFSGSDEIIADKGQVLERNHLKTLNNMVETRLNEIKADTEEELNRTQDRINVEIDRLRYLAEQEIEAQGDGSFQELDELKTRIQEQRQELMNIQAMQFLNEAQYRDLTDRWGNVFSSGMGAEALYNICTTLDLDKLADDLRIQIRGTRSKQLKKKAIKRLRVTESLRKSGNRPEWMILTILPVIPPDLRPMVQLDGGRFATSDLNDLYRRVINRNNRLRRLLDLTAPDVIVRN
ncbi:MAG: DNA-directed RNA polymerase subunit beta', partial [bacterium]|nr:DNA-directed RNA polymerase subunit beta' [bacterium]